MLFFDGKAFRPDGKTAATLIPPAFGLAGVDLATYTGWGSVTYWNALVANLEMHGRGNFDDDRLDNAQQFPVAAKNRFGHVRNRPDLITPKLPALHFYQLALPAPKPPKGSFDAAAARRGRAVFDGKGGCQGCHMQPIGHASPAGTWSSRRTSASTPSPPTARRRGDTGRRRWRGSSPAARAASTTTAASRRCSAVVEHYDSCHKLKLSGGEKSDLVQYLRSQ